MEQMKLALMGRMDGPSVVPMAVVKTIKTYREAVRAAWSMSRVNGGAQKRMQSVLAEATGMYAPHISDYFNADDKPSRRSLPAQNIPAFEAFVGNTCVSQWLAAQAKLTVLEEMQAQRIAA